MNNAADHFTNCETCQAEAEDLPDLPEDDEQ